MSIIPAKQKGFALIIVMLVVVSLGILAIGFAYSVKVETELARNASVESELEWMGRSGIELARYILALETAGPTTLTQVWAGMPAFEGPLAGLPNPYPLGRGELRWTIEDEGRKMNINELLRNRDNPQASGRLLLTEALSNIGLEATDVDSVVDSIIDWWDPGENEELGGAENGYYTSLDPPYFAKDGQIDDLSELLLVRGVTPELYYGGGGARPGGIFSRGSLDAPSEGYAVGLKDLFTTMAPRLNLNTAPASTLMLIHPLLDEEMAGEIISMRTEEPFPSVAAVLPALPPPLAAVIQPYLQMYCAVDSEVFQVTIEARIGSRHRTYVAMLQRPINSQAVRTLYMYWK